MQHVLVPGWLPLQASQQTELLILRKYNIISFLHFDQNTFVYCRELLLFYDLIANFIIKE